VSYFKPCTSSDPCHVCGTPTKGCSCTDDGYHQCRGEPLDPNLWVMVSDHDNGFRGYRLASQVHPHRLNRSSPDEFFARPRRPKPKDATPRPKRRPSPTNVSASTDWARKAAYYASVLSDHHREELARILRVPVPATYQIPQLGYIDAPTVLKNGEPIDPGHWVFPEADAAGNVIGALRRWRDGCNPTSDNDKLQMPGGRRGLSIPRDWKDNPGPFLCGEGATDALALAHAGCAGACRFSNSGGADQLAELLADWPADRPIVILGENDRRPDATRASGYHWPGRDGAFSVARKLAKLLNRDALVAFPPDGEKDVRDWLTDPRHDRDRRDWPARGFLLRSHVEKTAVTVPAADPDGPPVPADCTRTGGLVGRCGCPDHAGRTFYTGPAVETHDPTDFGPDPITAATLTALLAPADDPAQSDESVGAVAQSVIELLTPMHWCKNRRTMIVERRKTGKLGMVPFGCHRTDCPTCGLFKKRDLFQSTETYLPRLTSDDPTVGGWKLYLGVFDTGDEAAAVKYARRNGGKYLAIDTDDSVECLGMAVPPPPTTAGAILRHADDTEEPCRKLPGTVLLALLPAATPPPPAMVPADLTIAFRVMGHALFTSPRPPEGVKRFRAWRKSYDWGDKLVREPGDIKVRCPAKFDLDEASSILQTLGLLTTFWFGDPTAQGEPLGIGGAPAQALCVGLLLGGRTDGAATPDPDGITELARDWLKVIPKGILAGGRVESVLRDHLWESPFGRKAEIAGRLLDADRDDRDEASVEAAIGEVSRRTTAYYRDHPEEWEKLPPFFREWLAC
jgi:hypothetical protein